MPLNPKVIAVLGLGYVGLPLAVEIGKHRPVVGFDINPERIRELQAGNDPTLQGHDLSSAQHLAFTIDTQEIAHCSVFVIAVPIPLGPSRQPDFGPLRKASRIVGQLLKPGDLVIYESTAAPGTIDTICVPLLEQTSGLRLNEGFACGCSPCRTVPGDPELSLTKVRKVTAGSSPAAADAVDALYRSIVRAGTWRADSIRMAEAIAATAQLQRELHSAMRHELGVLFKRQGLDSAQVFDSVDDLYSRIRDRSAPSGAMPLFHAALQLKHKALAMDMHPELLQATARINESVPEQCADDILSILMRQGHTLLGARVLVLGLSVLPNCPEVRDTPVLRLIEALEDYGVVIDVHDPWVDPDAALEKTGLACLPTLPARNDYAAIVLAVAHQEFIELCAQGTPELGLPNAVWYDATGLLPAPQAQTCH